MIKKITIYLFLLSTINIYTQTLLKDNFNNGLSTEWNIIEDQPMYSGPSNWFIEDEVLRQTSNIWAYSGTDEFKYNLGTHIVNGNSEWGNYFFNVLMKATDNDGIGIIFRYQDEKNYYRFLLIEDQGNGGPKRRIQKFIDGEIYTLYEETLDDAIPNSWFSLTAEVISDSISIYINGSLFNTITDTTFKKGKIGLNCYAMSGAYFDSVSITSHSLIYDEPENKIVYNNRNPYIQLSTTNSVGVAWNTKQKVVGKVTYGESAQLTNTIEEDSASNKHIIIIEDLEPNTKYHYAVYNDNKVLESTNTLLSL